MTCYNRQFVLLSFALAILSSSLWAQQSPPRDACPKSVQPSSEKALSSSSEDPGEAIIASALRDWINPSDLDAEHDAVLTLFGDTHIIRRDALPKVVQKLLADRRLNYRHWESRRTALSNLARWFSNDELPLALVELLREGMKDPHPKVRARAAQELAHALFTVTSDAFVPKDRTKRAEFEKHRETCADQFVEMAIKRGLTDSDHDVLVAARFLLESKQVKPTFLRLRMLERVLDAKEVNEEIRSSATSIREAWRRSLGVP